MSVLITDLQQESNEYCDSLTSYSRYKTREVAVGNVPLGGIQPIRIQSMTTTDTMDTQATIAQSIRIIEAGAHYVRITAPSMNEARNLEAIQDGLRNRGFDTPLIADIHFTPNAAELAARIVGKVRINPGNYADRKKFQILEYSDLEYEAELERIREKFTPLVRVCQEYGTAMRIGTNHGSLSDRIMSRFGDTPLGMVESALEFTRICESMGYHQIVFSMKASNPQIMVQAYRLLVQKMEAEGMNYPLHLGVTEAGEGEDGRIKSAVGIGTLMEDGFGDTIRVSLTEEPESEIPVAITLANRYIDRSEHQPIPEIVQNPLAPYSYTRRTTVPVERIGGENIPIVIQTPDQLPITRESLIGMGYEYDQELDKWYISDQAADYIYLEEDLDFDLPGSLQKILDYPEWNAAIDRESSHPIFDIDQYLEAARLGGRIHFVKATLSDLTPTVLEILSSDDKAVLVLTTSNCHAMPELRRAFIELLNLRVQTPVVIQMSYEILDTTEFQLYSSTDLGGLLVDGQGDGIWIESSNPGTVNNRTAFGILQATRTRISKTEYISCPSCGRTLFDLQETTAHIRARTDHLKGVKIGIMGCIVNGPGEMADADYGYVGSGPGTITLYRGKEIVQRSIPTDGAVNELINLIKEDCRWIEP